MHIHPIYRMLIPKNPKLKGVGRTRGQGGLTPTKKADLRRGECYLSPRTFFSLTELTDLTERYYALFNSWGVFSLTELTDLTEHFNQRFEPTEGLRHTDITERYS